MNRLAPLQSLNCDKSTIECHAKRVFFNKNDKIEITMKVHSQTIVVVQELETLRIA